MIPSAAHPSYPVDVRAKTGSLITVERQGTAVIIGGFLDGAAPTGTAGSTLAAHMAVRAVAGFLVPFSTNDPAQFGVLLGITREAVAAQQDVSLVRSGPIDSDGWNWTPGLPVYAGTDGYLTQAEPSAGICQVVGIALLPTRIQVQIGLPILL